MERQLVTANSRFLKKVHVRSKGRSKGAQQKSRRLDSGANHWLGQTRMLTKLNRGNSVNTDHPSRELVDNKPSFNWCFYGNNRRFKSLDRPSDVTFVLTQCFKNNKFILLTVSSVLCLQGYRVRNGPWCTTWRDLTMTFKAGMKPSFMKSWKTTSSSPESWE